MNKTFYRFWFLHILFALSSFVLFLFFTQNRHAEKNNENNCDDVQRLRNDSFFFIEGIGAWQVKLRERRDDLRRLDAIPLYENRRGNSDLFIYHGHPREGTILFKGTVINRITAFFTDPDLLDAPDDIFYYSCRGFYYPDLIQSESHIDYLKNLYDSKSSSTGDWLYFPYVGVAYHFKNKKADAFMVFDKTPLKDGFRYMEFYNQEIY